MSIPRLVEVRIDPSLHTGTPPDETARVVWETLDTAWNLLRDGAVRAGIASIREASGGVLPSDEDLFAEGLASGDPDAPTSYRDLAPRSPLAAHSLSLAFNFLLEQVDKSMEASLVSLPGEEGE